MDENTQKIFEENNDILCIIKASEDNISIEIDDKKIDIPSAMIIFTEVVKSYIQSTQGDIDNG